MNFSIPMNQRFKEEYPKEITLYLLNRILRYIDEIWIVLRWRLLGISAAPTSEKTGRSSRWWCFILKFSGFGCEGMCSYSKLFSQPAVDQSQGLLIWGKDFPESRFGAIMLLGGMKHKKKGFWLFKMILTNFDWGE